MADLADLAPLLNPIPDQLPTHLTGEHAAQHNEFLRHRMDQRDVTVQEVRDFIALQHQPNVGMTMQPLEQFVTEKDLASFWWLHDWWAPVENKPNTLPTPSIIQFCWYVNHMPGAQPLTFDAAMQQFYSKAVAYCESAGMDPSAPGETAEDRRKRLNRERMAKVRGHLPVSAKKVKDEGTLAQVRALEAQCEQLKNEAKAEDERLRIAVVGFQTAMVEASSERKGTAQRYKEQIENLRTEIRTLTAKQ